MPADAAGERRRHIRELFRLQSELVKLQDWVQHTGHKLVILFEGRDAADIVVPEVYRAGPSIGACNAPRFPCSSSSP